MPRFGDIMNQAKKVIDKRGGKKAFGEDAKELKDIAGKEESGADKAKEAFEAIKDPGAKGDG